MIYLVLSTRGSGDYMPHGPIAGDNAGPAIDALGHGNIAGVVATQPLMGLGSILLRAPLTTIAGLLGGSDRIGYELGAIACLLPAALLVTWVASRALPRRAGWAAAVILAIAVLLSPATSQAVHLGHPEEVLAIVLATGAVLTASNGRAGWAAALLGAAVGTKQWALLAAPCVLLALPERRTAVAVRAGALALLLTATLPVLDPNAFRRADQVVGGLGFADPFSVWWPLGTPYPGHGAHDLTAHLLPLGITRSVAAATAIAIGLAALALYARRARCSTGHVDTLALLALAGLLRCIADPDPLTYNFVAVLIPLAVWETLAARRVPLLTVACTALVAIVPTGGTASLAGSALGTSPTLVNTAAIAISLALASYLAHRAFHSSRPRAVSPATLLGALRPTTERTWK